MTSKFFVRSDLKTYGDAVQEVQRLKKATGANMIYKIVKSGYSGFRIIALEPELYADMLTGKLPCPPDLMPGGALKYADMK